MDKTILNTLKVAGTALVVFVVLLVLYRLSSIFALLLVSLFVVLSVEPLVKNLMKKTLLNKPVSRKLAVASTYTLLVFVVLFIFTIGLPPVLSQAQKLLANIGEVFENIPGATSYITNIEAITTQTSSLTKEIVGRTASVLSSATAAITVFVLSLYISLDWIDLRKRFLNLFGKSYSLAESVLGEVELEMGHWVKAQLFLMVTVGFVSFLALSLLGVDYPLALGLLAGLFEIIPFFGPLITAVLAALVGFSISPAKGILVVLLFLVIQQVENNFLIPKVMGKVSGFSPLIVLVAVLVGGEFFGAIGAITAVPVVMILSIVFRRVYPKINRS